MNKEQRLLQIKAERAQYNKSWINSQTIVGDFTYADHPKIWTWGEGAKLYIGKFCSIAANVQFLLGGNHHTEWCTTYPFNVLLPDLYPNIEHHAITNGDIVIGNDVWIGNDVTILSGVTIGNGAVIANGAIVTKNVYPYSIIGGVPAKRIKDRFDGHIMLELENMKWWDWSLNILAEALPILCSNDYEKLIDFYHNNLTNV